jgi:autotransporter-associated beta strand protein
LVLNTDVLATNGVGSTISGNLLLGAVKRTFHLAPGYGLSIAAQISDNGPTVGFDLEGGGMLTLTGSNTFSGPLNVKAGVLYARNDNALGKITGGTTIWSGARLAIDGRNLGGEPFTLNGDGGDGYGALSCAKTNNCNGLVTLVSDATINVVSATDRLTFGSIVNGPQGITKIGAGALAFTGNQANTYSGATTVSEGALELNKHGQIAVPGALTIGDNLGLPLSQWVRALGTNQFAAGAPVTVNWSGVLDLSGATAGAQTVGSLVGIGPARLGANALTVGGNNADAQYNGSITGSANAALRKQGSGKWTLGGASDQFFGVTVVNGGKLFVQNWNPASPVTVNAGALLAGNGRVGTVTTAGGAFTPGGGLNQMKMESKDVGLDPSATFSVQLSGPIPGISYSQLSVTGLVNLANATLNPTLNFASSISNQFVLIVNDGSDPVTGTFKNLPQGGTLVLGGALFQISYQGGDGNDVVLTQISAITPLQIGGIAKQVGGVIQLHGAGLPGANYAIEANADLNTTNWINIGGVAADANGLISFIDLNAPNFPMRFYRFKTQ